MKYEIKYKIEYLSWWYDFPVIIIYYRHCGKIFWSKIKQSLDNFAQSKGLGEYNHDVSTYWIGKECRTVMFKQVIDASPYNGNLDAYVRSIVFDRIKTEMDSKNRLCETETMISGWVTTRWKSIELDCNDQDEVKQHSIE